MQEKITENEDYKLKYNNLNIDFNLLFIDYENLKDNNNKLIKKDEILESRFNNMENK